MLMLLGIVEIKLHTAIDWKTCTSVFHFSSETEFGQTKINISTTSLYNFPVCGQWYFKDRNTLYKVNCTL